MVNFKCKVWDIHKKVFIPNDVWALVSSDTKEFGIMLKDWENYQAGEYFYHNSQILILFTGLKDKNGKDIYEGDWCRAEFRTKEGIQVIQGHIIMDEFMWCIDCTDCVGDDIFSINRPHNFEIVGNIHEYPELLTTKP